MLHNESNDIAMRSAAEAVIELFVVVNGKRRCFFLMKRAASLMFTPCSLYADTPSDDLRQGQAIADIIQKARGNRHIYKLADGFQIARLFSDWAFLCVKKREKY